MKDACFNYHKLDLEDDLVGVLHNSTLSAISFITLLKLVWREEYMVALNNLKKCVGLHRTSTSHHYLLLNSFTLKA